MQATAMALIECLHELHRAEQNRASATKAADSSSSSAAEGPSCQRAQAPQGAWPASLSEPALGCRCGRRSRPRCGSASTRRG